MLVYSFRFVPERPRGCLTPENNVHKGTCFAKLLQRKLLAFAFAFISLATGEVAREGPKWGVCPQCARNLTRFELPLRTLIAIGQPLHQPQLPVGREVDNVLDLKVWVAEDPLLKPGKFRIVQY